MNVQGVGTGSPNQLSTLSEINSDILYVSSTGDSLFGTKKEIKMELVISFSVSPTGIGGESWRTVHFFLIIPDFCRGGGAYSNIIVEETLSLKPTGCKFFFLETLDTVNITNVQLDISLFP